MLCDLSMSPEEQMLRAAVLPPDVSAGELLTNLQSTAVLRHGFSGRIFSSRTQEQPDLQTVASGVSPGSGTRPGHHRGQTGPVRRAPTKGLRGHMHPGTGKGLLHGGACAYPGRPRAPARGGRVCCGRAEDRDAAWGWEEGVGGEGGRPKVEGQAEGVGADGPGLCLLSIEPSAPTAPTAVPAGRACGGSPRAIPLCMPRRGRF